MNFFNILIADLNFYEATLELTDEIIFIVTNFVVYFIFINSSILTFCAQNDDLHAYLSGCALIQIIYPCAST